MGFTKIEHFEDVFIEEARIFKALGHPARLAIVKMLLAKRTCVGADFTVSIPLAQPTISQHLRELKDAGIIRGRVEGTSVCYCVNIDVIDKLKSSFLPILNDFLNSQNCDC
jgi:ArsR family transcriptional regulator